MYVTEQEYNRMLLELNKSYASLIERVKALEDCQAEKKPASRGTSK